MKPINFIDNRDNKNSINKLNNKKLYFVLPILILLLIIIFDYTSLRNEIETSRKNINQISESEVIKLKLETENLKNEAERLKTAKDFLIKINSNKSKELELLNVIESSKNLQTDNTFLTSIILENSIVISGNSVEKSSILDLEKSLEDANLNFSTEELNYANGYYSFTMRGEINE